MVVTDTILVNWSKKIRRDNGRAHPLAVLMLSHIVAIIGKPNSYKRISYQRLEDDLGVTHDQALAALGTLEKCGVVRKDIRFEGGRNKLYVSIDQQGISDVSGTAFIFADTPEKSVIYKERNNSNSDNKNIKEKKRKVETRPIFQEVSSKESSGDKSKGMVKYEKVQVKVDAARAYTLRYLSDSQVDECWKKLKFRFFNQGGKRCCGDVVLYESDQKALSRMYFDMLMERCGNFDALMEIVGNMKFNDLARISVGLWNLLKMGDEELLGIARADCWTDDEKSRICFAPITERIAS